MPNNDHVQHIKTIHELLGIEPEGFSEIAGHHTVGELPAEVIPAEPVVQSYIPEVKTKKVWRDYATHDLVRMPLVFLVALGFFYVVLNFGAVSTQVRSWVSSPPKNQAAVLGANQIAYDAWIQKYYIYANDPQALAVNSDPDRDGLTNMDEFYLGANPFNPDTDGDGYDDGREVLNGYNPLYYGDALLTDEQKQIIHDHLDLPTIVSRKNYDQARGPVGYTGGIIENAAASTLPVDTFVLDPGKPGNLSIPKLGTNVAILWTADFAKMEDDLKYGVAHHPATVYPGQAGLSSIHGHSSGYPWDGKYINIFTKLNYLEAGDDVFVTVFDSSGVERRYHYVVKSAKVYAKDDAAQFQTPDSGSYLNISTSWPIGTARERYVVTTELAGL